MMNFYEAIECMKNGKYCICDYIKLKYPYMYIELVNNKEQEKDIVINSRKEKIPNSFPYLRAKLIDLLYISRIGELTQCQKQKINQIKQKYKQFQKNIKR